MCAAEEAPIGGSTGCSKASRECFGGSYCLDCCSALAEVDSGSVAKVGSAPGGPDGDAEGADGSKFEAWTCLAAH